VFERVQNVKRPRGRPGKSERLLARLGVLYCESCGGRMIVAHARSRTGKDGHEGWPSYKCPRRMKGDCPGRASISAPIIENLVADKVKDAIARIEGRASQGARVKKAEAAATRSNQQYDAARELMSDWTDAGAVKTLSELKAAWEADEEAAERERQRAGAAVVIRGARDWDKLTLEERRAVVRAVVERVTVAPGRGTDRVTVTLAGEYEPPKTPFGTI
jgi:hypothetical protein